MRTLFALVSVVSVSHGFLFGGLGGLFGGGGCGGGCAPPPPPPCCGGGGYASAPAPVYAAPSSSGYAVAPQYGGQQPQYAPQPAPYSPHVQQYAPPPPPAQYQPQYQPGAPVQQYAPQGQYAAPQPSLYSPQAPFQQYQSAPAPVYQQQQSQYRAPVQVQPQFRPAPVQEYIPRPAPAPQPSPDAYHETLPVSNYELVRTEQPAQQYVGPAPVTSVQTEVIAPQTQVQPTYQEQPQVVQHQVVEQPVEPQTVATLVTEVVEVETPAPELISPYKALAVDQSHQSHQTQNNEYGNTQRVAEVEPTPTGSEYGAVNKHVISNYQPAQNTEYGSESVPVAQPVSKPAQVAKPAPVQQVIETTEVEGSEYDEIAEEQPQQPATTSGGDYRKRKFKHARSARA